MAIINKPIEKPQWATGAEAQVISPTALKKSRGWISEKPPHQFFNWLSLWSFRWIEYFEQKLDFKDLEFDAVIGNMTGASHSSINALMADANINNIKRVLVLTSPGENQTINKTGMEFVFKPQAVVTKAASANGIIVAANNTKIIGAKFSGFSAAGNAGIKINAGIKNCLITQCSFLNCLIDISDLGNNNFLTANILEE